MSKKFVPQELRGSLFPNNRKEKETHADLRGDCLIGGVEYWLDAWHNDNGRIGISFKRKDSVQRKAPAPQAPGPVQEPFDDDEIPF